MKDRKINLRKEPMERLAYRLGYSFDEEREMGFSAFLSDFRLFKMGRKNPVNNVMFKKSKMHDFETAIFDYKYVVSTGKSVHIFRQSVCMFYNKKFALPHFYMIPEKWYHRLGKFFGLHDINFESYPKFSASYYLKGDDEAFIRHTFDQKEMMHLFEQNSGYHLEGCNYVFILYKFNTLLKEDELIKMLTIGSKLALAYGAKGAEWMNNHKEVMKLMRDQ